MLWWRHQRHHLPMIVLSSAEIVLSSEGYKFYQVRYNLNSMISYKVVLSISSRIDQKPFCFNKILVLLVSINKKFAIDTNT